MLFDLGYPDDGYQLPFMRIVSHVIAADHVSVQSIGFLFAFEACILIE
jgi:hypothetical protein